MKLCIKVHIVVNVDQRIIIVMIKLVIIIIVMTIVKLWVEFKKNVQIVKKDHTIIRNIVIII